MTNWCNPEHQLRYVSPSGDLRFRAVAIPHGIERESPEQDTHLRSSGERRESPPRLSKLLGRPQLPDEASIPLG
jgi:hypothetical protein